jgi:hypothetical protein
MPRRRAEVATAARLGRVVTAVEAGAVEVDEPSATRALAPPLLEIEADTTHAFNVAAAKPAGGYAVPLHRPLEPGVIDHKMYAFGIGNVLEQSEKGGNERNKLVAVARR